MPARGERSYAYAKACGIIGKSFTGSRVEALRSVGRLSELDRLVFPASSRDLPEKELLADMEERLLNREIKAVTTVVNSFRKPPEFLSLLIGSYKKDKGEPDGDKNDIQAQTERDRRYYESLWKALRKLSRKDRRASEHILGEEISLRNAAWALRLRTYYQMNKDEAASHLVDITTPVHGKIVSLAEDAISSLELPLDNFRGWDKWKRAKFLNPDAPNWRADPRYFQNAASRYLYRLARRSFRAVPSSLDSVYCFIKIKQFEEDVLTSSAEGLALGMTSGDIFGMLGVES